MFLKKLSLSGFRGLEDKIFDFGSVNNLVGPIGSGKTSLLESVYMLYTGTSFITKNIDLVLKNSSKELLIQGVNQKTFDDIDQNKIKVIYRNQKKECFLDEKKVTQGHLFLKHPICLIDAYANRIVSGTPDNRRKIIDRAMFHVEQDYLLTYKKYNKALKQRNRALKEGQRWQEIEVWNKELSIYGESLTKKRGEHIEATKQCFYDITKSFLGKGCSIEFKKGWQEKTLMLELEKNREKDLAMKRTTAGSQRDDFSLYLGDKQAQEHASHGQEKLVSLAYLFAQKNHIEKHINKKTLVLFDETDSNLDQAASAVVIEYIKSFKNQILTATHPHSNLHKSLAGNNIFLKQI